jgi:hypothetical protein
LVGNSLSNAMGWFWVEQQCAVPIKECMPVLCTPDSGRWSRLQSCKHSCTVLGATCSGQ